MQNEGDCVSTYVMAAFTRTAVMYSLLTSKSSLRSFVSVRVAAWTASTRKKKRIRENKKEVERDKIIKNKKEEEDKGEVKDEKEKGGRR